MAIAITSYSVVGLKSRIEEKFAGGINALLKIVPNVVQLADDEIWLCSFMVAADAGRFMEQLQQAGMETSQGPDPDFVMVSEFDHSVTPNCEWLQVGIWEKGVIVGMIGTAFDKVIAPLGWTWEKGSGNYAAELEKDVKFLRMDGELSVYFDKQKGCETYMRRTEPDPYELFVVASRAIQEHLIHPGLPVLTGEPVAKVRQAITCLESVSPEFPRDWRIHYYIGKGKQALGDLEGAYVSLKTAFLLEHESETVARDFAGICLQLGKADEAVQSAQKAAAIEPDNHETLGNLACAYLLAGRNAEAFTTINAALKLNADDRVGQYIRLIIDEVQTGIRTPPQSLGEMMTVRSPITDKPTGAC